MTKTKIVVIAVSGVVVAGLTLTACGHNKYNEPFNDAGRTGAQDNGSATVVTMPDGFNNLAVKCFGHDLIATIYHNDSSYGSVAISKDDPNCVDATTSNGTPRLFSVPEPMATP